ncbi:MAG TPA: hypothetical protein VFI25_14445 [Planctomycetota bacterium]|jgi:DnaJ-class molecular chaperone|nr:hypothetical protein [Planctomycetota bacterium]
MTIEMCGTCQGKGYIKGVACADCAGAGTKVPSKPKPKTAPAAAAAPKP